jgi:hypothetical protein
MIKRDELIAMRAIALCFKPFLKPEEALIYCNLGRTQFSKKCDEYRIYKTSGGYYKKDDIDRMLLGDAQSFSDLSKNLRTRKTA